MANLPEPEAVRARSVGGEAVIACRDDIHRRWLSLLREHPSRGASQLAEAIKRQHREGTDLLSLWVRVLENGGAGLAGASIPLIQNIHRLDYTIADLHLEVLCLKDAVGQALQTSSAKGKGGANSLLQPIFRSLDQLFGICLGETSVIYEMAVEQSARGYCHLGTDGSIQFANRAFHELVGCQSVAGDDFAAFFPGREAFVRDVVEGRLGSKPSIRRMLLKRPGGDRLIDVLVEIVPMIVDAMHEGACSSVTDISDIAQAELANFERSKRVFLKTDTDFKITYANEKAKELFARQADDLIGQYYPALFPETANQEELKKQVELRVSGEGDTYNLVYNRPTDQLQIPLLVNAWPELDSFGERVGHMAFIENRQMAELTRRIHDAIETGKKVEDMFASVLEIVRELVPFEFAIVGVYTETMSHWRSLTAYPELGDIWETYWWPLVPEFRDWMSGPGPHLIPDIDEWFKSFPEGAGVEETAQDPTALRLREEGYVAYALLPFWREDRVVATLSLASKIPDFFRDEHLHQLRKLPLGKAVHMAFYLRQREEADFFLNLIQRFGRSALETETADHHLRRVAAALVEGLCQFYHWQNVSIFKVDEENECFELLAQAESPNGGYRLAEPFRQKIEKGILGKAYQERRAINLRDAAQGELSEIYNPSNDRTKSELCMPIEIRGLILWLLNLEDSRRNVFCEEDERTLEKIVRELRSFLDGLFTSTTLKEIMEASHDGIVVTDRQGQIDLINRAAIKMLGLEHTEPRERSFAEFVAETKIKKIVGSASELNPSTQELIDANGSHLKTRMSIRPLMEGGHGGRVFFLENLTRDKRLKNLEATQSALGEIAAQTRMPLALTRNLLRKLTECADARQREFAEKAMRQLLKAEVVFERLILYGDAADGHHEKKNSVEIRDLFERVREQLPAEEANYVEGRNLDDVPAVIGDAYQLTFVLQSLITYFLSFRPPDGVIDVEAKLKRGHVAISVTGIAGDDYRPEPNVKGDRYDPSLKGRVRVALGEEVLKKFIENNHGGKYGPPQQRSDGRETIRIRLPAADASSPGAKQST